MCYFGDVMTVNNSTPGLIPYGVDWVFMHQRQTKTLRIFFHFGAFMSSEDKLNLKEVSNLVKCNL